MPDYAKRQAKGLKWHNTTLLLCLLLCLSCGGLAWGLSEELPSGADGASAEALTDRLLEAVKASAFQRAEGARWGFAGHRYLWHRGAGRVRVTLSEELIVYLELQTGHARALCEGEALKGEALGDATREALDAFNNDSFWAFAPFKVRDHGTERRVIKGPQGDQLLVTYNEGGSTPGDSYLWRLDEDGKPSAWKMWVSVIPIGGLEVSWSGWRQTRSGAWLSTEHSLAGATLRLEEPELTHRFEELNEKDPYLSEGW